LLHIVRLSSEAAQILSNFHCTRTAAACTWRRHRTSAPLHTCLPCTSRAQRPQHQRQHWHRIAQDDALFARNFAQLKAYYTDLKPLLPASEQEHPLLGLNLLRLLAQNRIAEFHIELELLDSAALASPHVEFPRRLEQQLMEGLYDRLYGAMEAAPSARMQCFVSQLQETVRAELAACAAAVRSCAFAIAVQSSNARA
jgi:CSN8/PSMD8/EIF3K family